MAGGSPFGGGGNPGQIIQATKTITFTGAANLGATGNLPIWTVSGGTIIVWWIAGRCTTTLTSSGGTIALGVTGSTSLFIPATVASTITSTNLHWVSATPAAGGVALPAATQNVITSANIVGTVATANITAGVLEFNMWYQPLTAGATVA